MGETKTFIWRPLGRDGKPGEPVEVEMLAEDHRDINRRIQEATPAQQPENYLLLDIFAHFPGTTIVRPATASGVPKPPEPKRRPEPVITGRYHGAHPTLTEEASGIEVEIENVGPLKPGGPGHSMLLEFEPGERLTSYDASFRATGDHHAIRREATRLFDRGFVRKDGELPNPAPRGREHVDAFRITEKGRAELYRLRQPAAR